MKKGYSGSTKALRRSAIDYALLVDRFLDPKIFPAVLEAIHKGKEGTEEFETICRKLEIPEKDIRMWTATAFAYCPPYYELHGKGTKTSRPQSTGQIW